MEGSRGIIVKAKKNLMRSTPMVSISRLITTYINEQDEADENHVGFFGIVTDDDDDDDDTTTTTTRPRGVNIDGEVIPFPSPLKVIALSFTKAARARIHKAGGKCLSFRQLPLSFHKKFLFTFSKHHNSVVIIKPHTNNNIIKGCSSSSRRSNQTTRRNVRRRIQGGQRGGDYYCIPTMTRAFMDNLNDDLLCEILMKLPAKTLGGLKVINKRWYSLISHPSFVVKHTSLLQTAARGGYSTFISLSFERLTTLLSFDSPSSPSLFTETAFTLSLPPDNLSMPTIDPQPTFYASGRGLLIARTDYHNYICNPLTKKYKCIPLPTKTLFFSIGLIFGGSTSSDQYDHNHYTLVCLVEVHNAFKFMIFMPKERRWRDSNKSCWISIDSNYSHMFCVRYTIPVCHGRIMHWLTYEGYIVAFNLDKEESRLIKIPKTALTVEVNHLCWSECAWLGVLEDEVILVVGTSKHEIVTWVLHDYENDKWKIKRKDVINPGSVPSTRIKPVFFDGRRFLFTIIYKPKSYYCLLMEHDVRTGVTKPLQSEGSNSSFGGSVHCVPITSTLIEV